MNTHWIAVNAIGLLRAHHSREAIAYLTRFDHGGLHIALVEVKHHRIAAAVRELRHVLAIVRRQYS